jgi:hypothetical protein
MRHILLHYYNAHRIALGIKNKLQLKNKKKKYTRSANDKLITKMKEETIDAVLYFSKHVL